MSIGSTKSRRRRKRELPRVKTKLVEKVAPEIGQIAVSERTWLIASAAVLLVAAFLRLYALKLVPLHHDEGVNGNFLVRLVREGLYQYDPTNYHGPTLYYFAAIIPWTLRFLFGVSAQNAYGLNTITIRLVPALFGLATIWLVLTLRRRLGAMATLCAAGLLAISPGAVYLSRYFIHESLFVFFTLGIVVAGLRCYEDGHPIYLILAAASAALLFATKETFIITVPVLVIALVSSQVYLWLRRSSSASRQQKHTSEQQQSVFSGRVRKDLERLGGPRNLAIWSLVAIAVFVTISVLFYSSFFSNWPKGVYDSLRTFQVWTKTGQEAHRHEWWTYIRSWLVYQESPLLTLGVVGAAIVIWKPANSFVLFAAFWTFGIIAAYSYVPYKTPWLMLNFIVPLALIGGHAIQWAYQKLGKEMSLLATLLVLLLVTGAPIRAFYFKELPWKTLIPGYQTIDLNFFNYDNDDQHYVYVYAHTRREMLKLIDEISRIAERSREGGLTGITIVSPDYWPLPWYLRDYSRVGYYAHMADSNEPMIIASESQGAEVQAKFGDRYNQVPSRLNDAGSYPLRPGVNLLLYVRRIPAGP